MKHLLSFFIVSILLTALSFGQADKPLNLKEAQEGLISRSPFIPEGFTEGARPSIQPTMPPQFELHGVIQLSGVWQFSLYDPKTKASKWIAQNDTTSSIKVVSYDPNRTAVTISENGQIQELTLKKPEALANTALLSSLLNPQEEHETPVPSASSESVTSKEKFLELLKNKKELEDRFKNMPKSRQRMPDLDDEDLDDLD